MIKNVALCSLLIFASFQKQSSIKNDQPVIIELVATDNKLIDIQKLKAFLVACKLQPNSLYQWKNHCVIFDKVEDVTAFRDKIRNFFPGFHIKVYQNLYYRFDRKERCYSSPIAKEWDHIILTTNLVKDEKMQQEYMNYHATQFQKWPEVTKGFCNANFQQLLGYRSGRQLFLVIRIPKGESLDC